MLHGFGGNACTMIENFAKIIWFRVFVFGNLLKRNPGCWEGVMTKHRKPISNTYHAAELWNNHTQHNTCEA